MAKKKEAPSTAGAPPPQIFEATVGAHGAVVKGAAITQAQAAARRKTGHDVVVCGSDLGAN
jgi:hypothetical protein